jgi:2-oxoisovalerate dehydrogenase E2 component (dihydrolipoyl transacylase)
VSRFEFKLPDLGEGTVEAEIVEWKVKAGDQVKEDDVIVDVMTDKASIEVPSPVTGTVVSTTGGPGDMVPVGSVLIVFETDTKSGTAPAEPTAPAARKVAAELPPPPKVDTEAEIEVEPEPKPSRRRKPVAPPTRTDAPAAPPRRTTARVSAQEPVRVLTSPSIRYRAREAGVDLSQIHGSGPDGRITAADFEAHVADSRPGTSQPAGGPVDENVEEIRVIGVRRAIARHLSEAKRTIPHFAYVEEVDITELESTRAYLSEQRDANLTYLPFLARALVRVLADFPQCNAHYDAERNVVRRFRTVHLGIATQTPDGLKVPVVHDAQDLSLRDLAREIRRVSEAARSNQATRDELTGSTITITSLGRLGGIASTPIINAPEVGIIGINKAVQRPMVVAGTIAVRLMMNLSSSFDHRFVDGYDAAAMIQALKALLEHPAAIFVD